MAGATWAACSWAGSAGVTLRPMAAPGERTQRLVEAGLVLSSELSLPCATSPRIHARWGFPQPSADALLPRRPVAARGQVFGNLYLTENQAAEEFDADDQRALEVLAAQAGVAIENAHLYQEVDDRARRLEAVRAVTGAILAGTKRGELLGLVVRQARELVGADLATLAVPAGEARLVIEAADGLDGDRLRGMAFPAEGR